ncbi:carbohydrate-binding family 9-like protein [uncultured Dysosmobacter sp.]
MPSPARPPVIFINAATRRRPPHFLAWSPLTCSAPDFHRRQDFGRLQFD